MLVLFVIAAVAFVLLIAALSDVPPEDPRG
jgi:hypothetical protein